MAAGKSTFIDTMIAKAGYENAATDERYPTYSEEEIRKMNLDEIWLSSEPYSFGEEDRLAFESMFGITTRLVDGEMFSWYGSRLLKSAEYFRRLHASSKGI
jgi:ABC-type hemin transport system substrate-binding protein